MARNFALSFAFVLVASGCSTLFPGSSSSGTGAPPTPTGCATSSPSPSAPGGYYVNGNTVCTASGNAHLFHGVDRPSLEWDPSGDHLSLGDFQLMASWKANAVRIALNQDFWLSGSTYYDASYAGRVDNAIASAEEAGMDVILDLHWSDAGTLGSCDPFAPKANCQQLMADVNSETFWSEVAARYKNDGRVLFELYNEPHDVSLSVWKSGGSTGSWQVVGMQQLYDTVRAAGAENLVVIGGLEFAYDLSGVPNNRISGYNILYATHPYNNSADKQPGSWDAHWGFLTETDPVIVTEFGDSSTCTPTYSSKVIAYADAHNASWTAWAWYAQSPPDDCSFPSLIIDWDATTSMTGAVVEAALGGYTDPAPDGKRDAGTPANDASANDASANDAGTSANDALANDAGTAGNDASASDATPARDGSAQ